MANYSQAASENGLSQEAYQVLAQANLFRVRGNWDDAVERCMAAMKIDPDNVSVLSLLGDIYENQGKLTEAMQWYRLALDKNPESPADQMKLKSTLTMMEHIAVAQAPELLAAKAASWSDAQEAVERPLSFNQNVLNITLRVAAYGLAAAFAIVVGYALTTSAPRGHRSPTSSNRDLNSDPILVHSNGPGSSTFSADYRDVSELALLNALAADPQLTGYGVSASDVSDDPRTAAITVTALYTSPDPTVRTKADILRAAVRIALETSAHTDIGSATTFTVRILVPIAHQTPIN